MLDTETKRRIDTCRDILVGKVPDPKSQVEQITVALIYKFMDDMDLEAEEMGGNPTFFTGEYEKFRWSKMVAPGVTGQDMLNTYSEALTKMVENDGLPALFRQIFRNAYLPYRDPETLRSFLREINSFTYDHSERLGDAFEYLLSVLGSQGDAGQFRTPRHIIDFMVEVIDPQKNEVIMDPACGTAGFLISAYKHILKMNSSDVVNGNGEEGGGDAAEQAIENPLRFKGDLMSPEDRQRLATNIKGYDISPDMVRLSLVNLYLHGFAAPKVEEYDTLTSEDKWTEMADVILANPPFMSPKGGIKPHTKFQVQSKRSEVLFVDYIAEHLTPNGRAAIVVPEGIIFQSQSAYVALRKMLVENHLAAVISLPAGVFNPYSGVKTSILILDRAVAKASKHVAFFKIENDGFQLGAQRKAQKGSQLPKVKAELTAWMQAARGGAGEELESILGNAVERERIGENGEFNLSAERYTEQLVRSSIFDYIPLNEICLLGAGNPAPQGDHYFENGTFPFVRTSDVGKVGRSARFSGAADTLTEAAIEELRLRQFPAGTVLFPKSGASTFLNHRVLLSEPAYVSSHLACIVPESEKALPEFVYHILCSVDARDLVPDQAYPSLRLNVLGELEIPLPPLEVQREIVAEIEGYQRVIDGARVVIDNYLPQIPIEPEWPIVELADVIVGKPKNGYSGKPVSYETDLKVLTLTATTSGVLDATKFKYIDEDIAPHAECRCRKNDIYLQRGNTAELVGTAAIFDLEDDGFIYPDLMIRVQADQEKITPDFLLAVLQASNTREFLKANATGSAGSMPKINQKIVNRIPIFLPPLETQENIVSEINAEKSIILGNRDLITRFEKKIEAAISRVWGEAKTDGEPA